MSIEYVVEGRKFGLSYTDLKENYLNVLEYTDEEFMQKLPEILHLTCMICYLKEVPSYVLLCDTGLIHELSHLMHIPDCPLVELQEVRRLFEMTCKLA